eukprot:scaffold198855_cov29-Tisochrysis_lutea.AAC.2
MFWDITILGHKAWLSGYWKLAFCTHRERLSRKELAWVRQHEHIIRAIAFIMSPPAPLALRTSAILLTGVARSHKLECTSLEEAVVRLDQQVSHIHPRKLTQAISHFRLLGQAHSPRSASSHNVSLILLLVAA